MSTPPPQVEPMPVCVRPARPADAGAIADAWRATCDELGLAPRGFCEDWRERLEGYFGEGIADGSQGWFVAAEGPQVVGTAGVLLGDSVLGAISFRHPGVLVGVYVAPHRRRAGLARAMVERAVAWARARGCTSVRLRASEAGAALYRSLGFEDVAEMVLKLD